MNIILIGQDDSNHAGTTEVPEKFVIDGKPTYDTWVSESFPVEGQMKTGLCSMQPGAMTIRNYPTDEVFTLVYGKFEITNEDGSVVVMNPGESGLIKKGWSGIWRNVEKSCKCYTSVG